MAATDLKRFFNPRAIAIIGASTDIRTINGKPLHYLKRHGFAGGLIPSTPNTPRSTECPVIPTCRRSRTTSTWR